MDCNKERFKQLIDSLKGLTRELREDSIRRDREMIDLQAEYDELEDRYQKSIEQVSEYIEELKEIRKHYVNDTNSDRR